MTETGSLSPFKIFEPSDFEFVSDFEFSASNFLFIS